MSVLNNLYNYFIVYVSLGEIKNMQQEGFIQKAIQYFRLEGELDDFERVHQNIQKDAVFKGTNLWILMFAIVVASIGLNMNSTAVIIGAMLISPLMGPINAMGYSIATYDFLLFRKSVNNFTFAVLSSLLASTTYFALSPVSTAHSELLARTTPTIYDVLIALFGGLAGTVAIASKQKGNTIPGVAIATALMPPLCTAGYGLATAKFSFFFGALYLFTINTVFIALSSLAVSQLLKFPIRSIVKDSQKKIINRWISFVIVLVSFPSLYFGYNLVQKEKFIENANKYVHNVSYFEGNYLLKSEVLADKNTVHLVYGGVTMTDEQKQKIMEKATDFSLKNVKIEIQQGLAIDEIDSNVELETARFEINSLTQTLKKQNQLLDSIHAEKTYGLQLLEEINVMQPEITSCTFAKTYSYFSNKKRPEEITMVVFTTKPELDSQNKEKINDWLKKRLNTSDILVFFQ